MEGPDLPEEIAHHCIAKLNETHVIFSGGMDNEDVPKSSVYMYDLDHDTWTQLSDMLLPRYFQMFKTCLHYL